MSKGKGKRRRLKNQQLAVQAKRNFRSFMGHGSVVHDGSEISEGKGKQKDGLSKNLRFIMQFCNKNSTTQEEEEKKKDQDGVDSRSERVASTVSSGSQSMKKDMNDKTKTNSSTSSKKLQGQDKETKSGDEDDVKVQQKHQRKGTKAKKNSKEEYEYTFKKQAGNPRNGKLVLEQIKKKKKKKGYLDIRREKKLAKRQRKMQPDEDEDLRYDNRRFFDEVAYEPPKLAIEKSKLFYNNKGRGK